MHPLTKELYKKYYEFDDQVFSLLPSETYTIEGNQLFLEVMEAFYNCAYLRNDMRRSLSIFQRTNNNLYKKFRIKLYHMLMRGYIIYDIRCIIISYIL